MMDKRICLNCYHRFRKAEINEDGLICITDLCLFDPTEPMEILDLKTGCAGFQDLLYQKKI